jgi:hypothetical protein
MQIKEGASLSGLQLAMRPALQVAEYVWKEYGEELVVTSGTDGVHSAGSLHYYGYALDFRTRYFDYETKMKVFRDLVYQLRKRQGFVVLLEKDHIHVEYRKPIED